MEHKVIGIIGMAFGFAAMALCGVFIQRRMVDPLPASRFRLLLLLWTAIVVPVTVGFYYRDNFLSDGKTGIGHLLWNLPVCVMFAAAWLSSLWRRRRKGGRQRP